MEKSLAGSILDDYKKANKRMFIILLFTLFILLLTGIYLIYVLNDIGSYDEQTIDIENVETIDNSHIKIGDDIWEKSE